jgi:hypothetical protein
MTYLFTVWIQRDSGVSIRHNILPTIRLEVLSVSYISFGSPSETKAISETLAESWIRDGLPKACFQIQDIAKIRNLEYTGEMRSFGRPGENTGPR